MPGEVDQPPEAIGEAGRMGTGRGLVADWFGSKMRGKMVSHF